MEEQYLVEQVEGKQNTPTLKINSLYIHSKYRPIEESKNIALEHFEKHYTFVVFGYGLGYIVEELLNLTTKEPIIIIDPLLDSGQLQIKEHHLNNERIYIWGKQYSKTRGTLLYLIERVSLGIKTMVKIVLTPYYDKLFTTTYREVLNDVRNYLVRTHVNINTVNICAERWQKNLSLNLLNILGDSTIASLEKVYNYPVVIASGGPSLNQQLPLLKKIKDKVIIIAAGTTINSLLKFDIEPHYVVSIDGSEVNYNNFKNLELGNTRLLYSPFNHWAIRPLFKKGHSFTSTIYDSIATYIYKTIDKNMPKLLGGGTVAHFAFSIASVISTGPIAFIGQDLAFTNNVTHADANQGKKTLKEVQADNSTLFEIEGYYGDKVITDGGFLSMKQTFEEMARLYTAMNIKFYNCTEGGARINDFTQITFQEFINKFVEEEIDIVEPLVETTLNFDLITAQLQKELELSDTLVEIAQDGIEILQSNKQDTHFSQDILEELDEIDTEILNLIKEIQMDFLIQPILLKLDGAFLAKKEETPEEAYERSYNQTKLFYEEILGIVDKSMENIKETLEILTNKEKLNEFYRK
ncbi:DUF115 domain-containing protein [Metasolibacillus meyeri]|uniref:DUF115 domain-containing protein n=1 Tax=Metasolibacillus meyeri TaxID=1071052 RepID=A0AAW9NWV9_9BACL|nr:6-hydroxymethylpterin diphosphokinase MptE-like protein [Metasolibacillus meyeri]MEC1178883.1 DUF115 domain-containing protein [Metasolibacillus meyeri]